MNLTRSMMTTLAMMALFAVSLPVSAQDAGSALKNQTSGTTKTSQTPAVPRRKKLARRKPPSGQPVIPPVTLLNNPEYLSGEASVSVAANSNPLVRIGMAQNGVTLIEFPAADKFFAIHAGNSDLVTVEKSPSLKRDHHLILRAGSGFLVPAARARGPQAIVPATSIIAQMDSGMAITVMVYPVALLKQQAHRVVIKYNPEEVVTARRAAGLAINLVGPEAGSHWELATPTPAADSAAKAPTSTAKAEPARSGTNGPRPKPDYMEPVGAALSEAIKNPKWFTKWTKERHGLMISTLPPRELSDRARLVLFAVHNAGREPLRIISGYPDLYVETLNETRRPVEAGTKIEKLNVASSADDNSIQPGATCYFVLAYEAPILSAQQHLKIVVAHMSAADEPAMADLTAIAR
jgi:hypothetical protein